MPWCQEWKFAPYWFLLFMFDQVIRRCLNKKMSPWNPSLQLYNRGIIILKQDSYPAFSLYNNFAKNWATMMLFSFLISDFLPVMLALHKVVTFLFQKTLTYLLCGKLHICIKENSNYFLPELLWKLMFASTSIYIQKVSARQLSIPSPINSKMYVPLSYWLIV